MLRSRTIREGSVGLFALFGLLVFGGVTIWLRGGGWGEKTYQFTADFTDVEGLQIGSPVRYRGVTVGKLIALSPQADKVSALLEISSVNTIIPSDATVKTNRYGLIGEASIEITPLSSLSPEAQGMNPLSADCQDNLIICNNARVSGEAGQQLVSSLTALSETLNDPDLFKNLKSAAINTSNAAQKIAVLSDEALVLSKAARKDLDQVTTDFSRTSESLKQTADNASTLVNNLNGVVNENREQFSTTLANTAVLAENANQFVEENGAVISTTLDKVSQLSDKMTALSDNLNETTVKLNKVLDAADTAKIMQNLEVLTTNGAILSEDLRAVSKNLNDPATIVTLQQTLDSARATFENTQKLTADLDELIGDPEFREKVRRLINGLSDLVSTGEELQQQIQIVQQLNLENQTPKDPVESTLTKKIVQNPLSNSSAQPSE